MKLELQDRSQEVARIGHIGRHVILCRGIKIRLGALYGRSDSLILLSQFPPRLVVILRLDLPGKDTPAPLVNERSEERRVGKERRHGGDPDAYSRKPARGTRAAP